MMKVKSPQHLIFLITAIALISSWGLRHSQSIFSTEWTRLYGDASTGAGFGCSILFDDGTFILTGGTSSTSFYGASSAETRSKSYILKIDSTGNVLSSYLYGEAVSSSSRGCFLDSNGNIYLVGRTFANPFYSIPNKGGNDVFLLKLNANGSVLESRTYGGLRADNTNAAKIDSSGKIYIVGDTRSETFDGTATTANNTYPAGFLLILSNDLTIQHKIFIKGLWGLANDVEISPDGFIYVIGRINNNIPEEPFSPAYIAKFDSNGNQIWRVNINARMIHENALAVTVDKNGMIYVGGNSLNGDGIRDVFVAKFDSNGNQIWIRYFISDQDSIVYDIIEDGFGNIYISGNTYGLVFGGENNSGEPDLFILKYDLNGNLLGSMLFGGSSYDNAIKLASDADGKIYVLGNTSSPIFITESLIGTDSAFLVKICGNMVAGQCVTPSPPVTDAGNILRLSLISIGDCDDLKFHGKEIQCANIGKHFCANTTINASSSFLFKYFDDGTIVYKPKNSAATNMKYKSFLPNISGGKFSDLDSKRPYILFKTAESLAIEGTCDGYFLKIAIFSNNSDLNDFIYENELSVATSSLIYAYKNAGEDIQGNEDIASTIVTISP